MIPSAHSVGGGVEHKNQERAMSMLVTQHRHGFYVNPHFYEKNIHHHFALFICRFMC